GIRDFHVTGVQTCALPISFLYKNAPMGDEGYLTQMRSKIVNRAYLNSIGKKLHLIKFIRSKTKISNFGDNIYGNLLEALIGAIRSEERRVGKECRYRWSKY